MDFYYQGHWRFDWGLGNPNKTAAILACMAVAVWLLVFIRRWLFWPALTLSSCITIGLLHTYSRGGLVALAAGLSILAVFQRHEGTRWEKGGIACSVLLLLIYATSIQAMQRVTNPLIEKDLSIYNRLAIWRETPRMMVAAPDGWGLGNAAEAYHQWFQTVVPNQKYKSLVSSHLTWLVEFNWWQRALYITAWISALAICWPFAEARWLSVSFGILAAFGTASTFSSVAETAVVWIIPVLAICTAVCARVWFGRRLTRETIGAIAAASTATMLFILLWGLTSQGVHIEKHGGTITVGESEDKSVAMIGADPMVLGSDYGQTMREASKKHGILFILCENWSERGMETDITLLAGRSPVPPANASVRGTLLLLNPKIAPSQLNLSEARNGLNVIAIFGAFSQSSSKPKWYNSSSYKVMELKAQGDFLMEWPSLVLPYMIHAK